jgi:DNA-directed RNA polymerase specialized sigma subunit
MYKDLKNMMEDKKILEEEIRGLEERIKYKIQKELGLHSTTFKELKIEALNIIDDRFARVFAKVEELDKSRELRQGELDIINNILNSIDELISKMSDTEKKVFRCRYYWGLNLRQTAERLGYSIAYVKEISQKICKK